MRVSVAMLAALLLAGPKIAAGDDLENSFQQLKDAEAKKDAAQVRRLALETSALARKLEAEPAPEGNTDNDTWKQRVAYARQVEVHAEYALYGTALASPAATRVELLSALEELNPKSQYLSEVYGAYFLALTDLRATAKIPAVARKAITHFPDNEDLLLVLANSAMDAKQNARALAYAERLIAVLDKHPKPEGIQAADWARKRDASLGRGHWIAGVMHNENREYFEADTNLRAALPLIKGNDAMTGAALFYLGVANYQIGRTTANRARILEAAKFSDRAAAIPGPFAQQAWRNAHIMRTDALKMP